MVYCGKASQGCQNCRTRRIKCDKVRPQCSQCVRVEKKCPGYRDQLSLMFRDESSKVMQKAHAQWGGSPTSSPTDTSPASSSSMSATLDSSTSEDTASNFNTFPSSSNELTRRRGSDQAPIPQKVELTVHERGLHFYLQYYLMNHPDAPKTPEEISIYFSGASAIENTMIAVGLASLSNVQGKKELNLLARQRYTTALKQTGQLIKQASSNPALVTLPVRTIVSLALFEVVQGKGSPVSAASANIHLQGAVALLRTIMPTATAPNGGARGVLQLMFSMFIPSQLTKEPIPAAFFECLKICQENLQGHSESCCVDLAIAITKLLHFLFKMRQVEWHDDSPTVDSLVQQIYGLQIAFDGLDDALWMTYPFSINRTKASPKAIFREQWHGYSEIWSARIWNHYRWARILVNETILEFTKKCPISSAKFFPPTETLRCYRILAKMAEDTIVSIPAHWRHPALTPEEVKLFEPESKGGSGAVGVPSLLWQLLVAGCAPGVDPYLWDFCHQIMETVWKTLGMTHAQSLAEVMEQWRADREKEKLDRIIKVEDDNEA